MHTNFEVFSFLENDNFILDIYAWTILWLDSSIIKCTASIMPTFITNKNDYHFGISYYSIFIMIIAIDFINAIAFCFHIIFETYSEKLFKI